jgi:hypothetical protein
VYACAYSSKFNFIASCGLERKVCVSEVKF